jgi:tRNA-specific 2-thiouridylase
MKIAVLLSGGVDSSAALFRLKEEGNHDLHAYYLKIWLEDELSYLGDCPWEEDLAYARAVCEQAQVPLTVVPLQTAYYEKVVSYSLEELKAGRTPSPDIFCNRRVKFGAFFDAVDQSFDKVASGHYAVVGQENGLFKLWRSPDPVKDQSYFLSHLTQEQVSKVLFPIGELHKSEVRRLARQWDLANKDRKDSQGICFLGKIKYNDFVKFYLGEKKGAIVERETGRVLGEHRGFWFHTVGQRQGLGLGNGPWFVVAKDVDSNVVWVSHQEHLENQARIEFVCGNLSWISREPDVHEVFTCKLRHGPDLIPCSLQKETGPEGDARLRVRLERPDRGLAPGQFCVLYSGRECLGGGMILASFQ